MENTSNEFNKIDSVEELLSKAAELKVSQVVCATLF